MRAPGDRVRKGEPIVEIEPDKVTVEIESPASGILNHVTAHEGDVIPVGHTIALITAAGEAPSPTPSSTLSPVGRGQGEGPGVEGAGGEGARAEGVKASPLARRIPEGPGVDPARTKTPSAHI